MKVLSVAAGYIAILTIFVGGSHVTLGITQGPQDEKDEEVEQQEILEEKGKLIAKLAGFSTVT